MPKTFLLTGSSRGLGRSIACAVLDAGHQLVATARNPEKLQDLVERHGDRILPVALDVTDYAAAKRAVALGVARFGRLDVVVNNAGFANVGSVEDMPPAAIEAQFATNFMGSVHVIKSALPILRAQGSGRLIQISSIGARIATAGAAAYYATKWALSGFVESLALEVAPLGIHVTAIEPSVVDSGALRSSCRWSAEHADSPFPNELNEYPMSKMIFISLPVTDLPASTAFYKALGFEQNAHFSDDTVACMIWSESIRVMLLTHAKWRTFTQRPFPPAGTSGLMLSLAMDTREGVDAMNRAAAAHGGQADANPAEDFGFMYSRDLADPDGHLWAAFWMDPAATPAPKT